MLPAFYSNNLYPLQDKVFEVIAPLNTDFYLTGGTALSRIYLQHRYSDDLDFFMNNSPDFKLQTEKVNKSLTTIFKENFKIIAVDSMFVRSMLSMNNTDLKIDFVNDIEYRYGTLVHWHKFPLIDHPLNILSNKIGALSRFAEKDIADILFLSYFLEFNCEFIISEAKKKDMWVNAIDVSHFINTFPPAKFENIIWTEEQNMKKFTEDLKIISEEVLKGKDNSLYVKKEKV